MPKVTADALPVSGMFGVVKPSGPTSMKVLDDIKPLLYASKLFMDEKKLESAGKDAGKGKGKKRGKWRKMNSDLKIGQGGTLDPLADGVLGATLARYSYLLWSHNNGVSCRRREGYQAFE